MVQGSREWWLWENEVYNETYNGDGISDEIIIFFREVVSVYLVTDRNYVFKS